MKIDNSHIHQFQTQGLLELPNFYNNKIVAQLKKEADNLSLLEEIPNKWMKYYETSERNKEKLLCRVENFIHYNRFLFDLLNDSDLLLIIEKLFGEPPVLFKEKINYKLPGANSFTPHQDAPAYSMFPCDLFITVMICIDNCNSDNGGLEFAIGRHKEGVFNQSPSGDIAVSVCNELKWKMINLQAGDIVLFDSFIPHKSGINFSTNSRRAIFATYNKLSYGNLRNKYFQFKREKFPPDYERDPLKNYEINNPFNIANPIK